MTRAGFLFVVGGTLLGVLVAVAWVRARAPNNVADTNAVSERVDQQRAAPSVIELREHSVARGEGSAAPRREPLPEAPSVTSPTITLPRIVEELRLRYPHTGPLIETVEYRLASEGRDALRSAAMEARILREISQKALSLALVNLQADCKITLCRVQMTFPEELARKQFAPTVPGIGWTGEQPLNVFFDALDLEFEHTLSGLDGYGTPLVVGYVTMPPSRD